MRGAIASAQVLRIRFGMLSGPDALAGLRFLSNLATPSVLMVRLSRVGKGTPFHSGGSELSRLVKTD